MFYQFRIVSLYENAALLYRCTRGLVKGGHDAPSGGLKLKAGEATPLGSVEARELPIISLCV